MYNFRNNKLGMTLIEMVISLVVLGILTTSTMGIIISSNNIFVSTSNAALDRQVGGYVFETLSSVLKYTTHMTIYDAEDAPANDKSQNISVDVTDEENDAGKIMYKAQGADSAVYLYADSFYGNRTISYKLEEAGTAHKHVKLTVAVYREGKKRYELSRVIKCLNLALISTGADANFIKDLSTPGGTNQYISFSVDEQLISGGKDAYSLEYKIAEFMAKYNRIQNEYGGKLAKVYGEVNGKIGNTENKEGKRVAEATYTSVVNMRQTAVYGTGAEVWEDATNSPYNYRSLRQHYQKEINDLLHFTPTAAFTNDDKNNPYYGVVATKEELYTGFLLEYYSENNKHEKVTKASFPQFSDPNTFFSGTSIANYMSNTSGSNQMVILAYFKDNCNEDFTKLYSASRKKVFTYSGSTEIGYSHSVWYAQGDVAGNNLKDLNSSIAANAETKPSNNSMNSAPGYNGHAANAYFTIDTGEYTTVDMFDFASIISLHYKWAYKVSSSANNDNYQLTHYTESSRGYTTVTNYDKNAKSGAEVASILAASATQITNDGVNYVVYEGHPFDYGSNRNTFYIYPLKDMKQGWYYYKDSVWYHFFYLAADPTNNANLIAVKAQPKLAGDDASEKKYSQNARIVFDMKNYQYYNQRMSGFTYAQAKYGQMEAGANSIENVLLESVAIHQYQDYILYGADWNSWFLKNPSNGIINKIMTGTVNIVDTIISSITGGEKSFAKQDITEITGSNATLSLGNRGQMTVDKTDTDVASYNMAWLIYSPKRGTWYYLPQSSTRITAAASKLTITSSKDHPTPLDVDINGGKTWVSSAAMVSDIDKRKLSSSGLFGLVDTTSDVNWVGLPTGNQVSVDFETPTIN